jgi:small subunit ribosomal protein S17
MIKMAKEKQRTENATKSHEQMAAEKSSCGDRNCPIHGDLKTRGRVFIGMVLKSGSQKTSTVAWERKYYIPKYERYEKRRTKIHSHNPPCINAKEGDIVRIAECRPLSKTKKSVIIEKIGKKETRPLVEEETPDKHKERKDHKDAKDHESKDKDHKKTEKSDR